MSIDIRDLQPNRPPMAPQVNSEPREPAVRDGVRGDGVRGDGVRGDDSRRAEADSIALSPEAKRLKQLEAAARIEPDVDMAKVDQIRQEIADGKYHVDAEKLAGRMLDLEQALSR